MVMRRPALARPCRPAIGLQKGSTMWIVGVIIIAAAIGYLVVKRQRASS